MYDVAFSGEKKQRLKIAIIELAILYELADIELVRSYDAVE